MSGGDLVGRIRLNNNSIYGIKNSIDKTYVVNREYINDKLNLKMNKSGGIFTGQVNMAGNKIITYRNDDIQELVSKGYVDNKIANIKTSNTNLTNYMTKNKFVSSYEDSNGDIYLEQQ